MASVLMACGDDDGSAPTDAGGTMDGRTADGGSPPDGGRPDGGEADAAEGDAGTGTDGGDTDAGGPSDGGGSGAPCVIAGGVSCAAAEFCDYPMSSCGQEASSGMCRARPEVCPAVVMPVCGCDGSDYNNACEANRQGTDVAYDGTCASRSFDCRPRPCSNPMQRCQRCMCPESGGCYVCLLPTEMC